MTFLSFLIVILSLLILTSFSSAKFQETYSGIATDGVQACINKSNFTQETIILKQNCREAFKCVMDNIPNYGQTILSSGSAILGFIPTVHLILGPSNADIMRIHARYPILAFFLSITNINKRPDRSHHHMPPQSTDIVPLGPYGFARVNSTGLNTWTKCISIWAAHVLSCVGAAIVIWQAYNIGQNAVVSWACWTDTYPMVWVVISVVHHVSAVTCLRLSLRCSSPPQPLSKRWSMLWIWDLTQPDLGISVANRKWARWDKAANDLLNNANYLYGTAVFSSLTLVTGHTAIQKLATLGVTAFLSKDATVWILEGMQENG